jgi:hypothetical protein
MSLVNCFYRTTECAEPTSQETMYKLKQTVASIDFEFLRQLSFQLAAYLINGLPLLTLSGRTTKGDCRHFLSMGLVSLYAMHHAGCKLKGLILCTGLVR